MNTREIIQLPLVFLVVFILFEIALQSLFPHLGAIYEPDDTLLFKLRPNAIKIRQTDGAGPVVNAINSKGIRDYEYPYEKPPGIKRVIVIGDSFVQGDVIQFNKTLPKVIERELNKNGSYQVLNFGTVAYSPDQEYFLLINEGMKYHPDIVVLAVFAGNDFNDLVRNGIFSLENGELFHRNPGLDPLFRAKFWLSSKTVMPNLIYQKILPKIRGILREEQNASFTKESVDSRIEPTESIDNTAILLEDVQFPDVFLYPEPQSASYKITLMDSIIGRFREASKENGFKLIIVYVPGKFDANETAYQKILDKYDTAGYELQLERPSMVLKNITGKYGIRYVNLLPEFMENWKIYFWGSDYEIHWSNEGYEVAGERISKAVLKGD